MFVNLTRPNRFALALPRFPLVVSPRKLSWENDVLVLMPNLLSLSYISAFELLSVCECQIWDMEGGACWMDGMLFEKTTWRSSSLPAYMNIRFFSFNPDRFSDVETISRGYEIAQSCVFAIISSFNVSAGRGDSASGFLSTNTPSEVMVMDGWSCMASRMEFSEK